MKFKKGDRVILPACQPEGWTEQRGVVRDVEPKSILVLVDAKYRDDKWDDGLREVDPKDLRKEKK